MYNKYLQDSRNKFDADTKAKLQAEQRIYNRTQAQSRRLTLQVHNYKHRIATFIKDSTVDPVKDPDQVVKNINLINEFQSKMKGGKAMHYGAPRTDRERLDKAIRVQEDLDTSPTQPEHKNWDLRKRDRSAEVGRQFRFDANLQVQRIMDNLQHNIGKEYDSTDINGHGNAKALKEFTKTGKHDFRTDVDETQYDSDTELKEALKRNGKIHQTTYVVEPRKVMSRFHKRLFNKGAQAIGLDYGVMKISSRLHNEEFIEAQTNLHPDNDTVNLTAKLKKRLSQESVQDAEDAKLNRMKIMQDKKLDYQKITNESLRFTGFQRSPVAALPENFLRSRSGPGAWGHTVAGKTETLRSDYGKIGFSRTPRTAEQSRRVRDVSLMDQSELSTHYQSLMKTESRGIVTRHKDVVLRKELTIPAYLQRSLINKDN